MFSVMVVIHHRACCPASVGAAVAVRAGALTQTQLQMVSAVHHVPGCRNCLRPGEMVLGPASSVGELYCQVEKLKEEVSRLRISREGEERQDLL